MVRRSHECFAAWAVESLEFANSKLDRAQPKVTIHVAHDRRDWRRGIRLKRLNLDGLLGYHEEINLGKDEKQASWKPSGWEHREKANLYMVAGLCWCFFARLRTGKAHSSIIMSMFKVQQSLNSLEFVAIKQNTDKIVENVRKTGDQHDFDHYRHKILGELLHYFGVRSARLIALSSECKGVVRQQSEPRNHHCRVRQRTESWDSASGVYTRWKHLCPCIFPGLGVSGRHHEAAVDNDGGPVDADVRQLAGLAVLASPHAQPCYVEWRCDNRLNHSSQQHFFQ